MTAERPIGTSTPAGRRARIRQALAYGAQSVTALRETTGIPDHVLRRHLRELVQGKRIISRLTAGENGVRVTIYALPDWRGPRVPTGASWLETLGADIPDLRSRRSEAMGPVPQRVMRFMDERGADGATSREIADKLTMRIGLVTATLSSLRRDGAVVSRAIRGGSYGPRMRWYAVRAGCVHK